MDSIEMVIEPRNRPVGESTVQRLLPYRHRRMVGPFIFADLIGPDTLDPGVGTDINAHPHIGLATVTYLIEGRLVHRDSTGAVQTIEAGAVNWMNAGSGVTHTERSHPDDRPATTRIHGLQTWVALPDGAEDTPPSFSHHPARTLPEDTIDRAQVRLLAGTGWGLEAPVGVSSPLILAELRLDDRGSITIAASHPERAILVIEGRLRLDGSHLIPGRLVVLSPGSRPLLTGEGHAMVLGGDPVGRRNIWWNFVHSDRDRIEQAKADWRAQRFPLVPDDHHPFEPLPN